MKKIAPLLLSAFLLAACGTTEGNNTSDVNENGQVTEQSAEKAEKEDPNKIKAGTYKVGTDLPAGEYLVFAKGMAYIEATSDSTGQFESIIFNDNLSSDSHAYVTLNDGEYFKLQSADMYPVESAPSVIPEDGLYKDGMYKVGKDIPAGEYKVTVTGSMGSGYLEVASHSRHTFDGIISNDNLQADSYITVSDGQYLKLKGLQIQK